MKEKQVAKALANKNPPQASLKQEEVTTISITLLPVKNLGCSIHFHSPRPDRSHELQLLFHID